MQAHQSAKGGHDEFVVDNVNRESKSIILLHNLLLIEHVKHNLFNDLINALVESPTSIRGNTFISNESVILNFLEILC